MRLNHQFVVIKDLDIYDKVGYGVAHDEYVPFSVKNGKLNIGQHSAPFSGSLYVEFVKVSRQHYKFFFAEEGIKKYPKNSGLEN